MRTLLDLVRMEKGLLSKRDLRDIRGNPEAELLPLPVTPPPPRSIELTEGYVLVRTPPPWQPPLPLLLPPHGLLMLLPGVPPSHLEVEKGMFNE